MNFQKRLMVFFMTYIVFVIAFFFWANLLLLIIPFIGLLFLGLGGLFHVRHHD